MEQVGKIQKIDGNIATILVKRVSMCGDNCKSCSSACKVNGIVIETEVTNDIKVGDYVEISTENEVMFKHILMLYGTPFVIMLGVIFAVMLLMQNNPNGDLISAISGIASLGISYFVLKNYDKKEMKNNAIKYTVAKKL
nr:SoxR reducing system RseC family protein [Sedimentibacter sp.]